MERDDIIRFGAGSGAGRDSEGMMGKRLDYREELTRRAADCAAQLLDADRTGARFPVLPTLDLLIEAWLEGYRAASRPRGET